MARDQRTRGRNWWPKEAITDDDFEAAVTAGQVDVMVTHDAPHGVAVPVDKNVGWPDDAVVEADRHRLTPRRAVDAVRPRQLWHGHHHVKYDADLVLDDPAAPGNAFVCHVHGLDRDDTYWARNLVLVNKAGQPQNWPNAE